MKTFALRTLLTVITGRLLTEPKGDRDNGISDLYELLGWMTNDSPMTHQLARFNEECKPWLLRWFPELGLANVSLASLDKWLAVDKSGGQEGIKMWVAELKMLFPQIKDAYEVPPIPADDHTVKNGYDELVEMLGGDENIIILDTTTKDGVK